MLFRPMFIPSPDNHIAINLIYFISSVLFSRGFLLIFSLLNEIQNNFTLYQLLFFPLYNMSNLLFYLCCIDYKSVFLHNLFKSWLLFYFNNNLFVLKKYGQRTSILQNKNEIRKIYADVI
ncbi:hypothetical protein EDEG_02571 [Edhazardia aedis USNM 41457]|uniref:Uncharacterized protein n=1 Tax=Edhazardia aedis (strain USNM 41457) TaxID=1003232 RepID=J9D672_EDHAE|nr:hypothetical protein EDEG_02571 [Edhazardia aedis USNM 41457]|eukprot:EJW03039.1 hypothetical protein EDEG_02571 [Edhazardia aedis USNM 41457]